MAKLKQSLKAVSRRFENAASAFTAGEGGPLAIERHRGLDVAFRRGTTDERVIAHSFDNDIFFSAVPDYTPGQSDVILDIGAHIGSFALLAAQLAHKGRIHAIEASAGTFNYLRINQSINRLEQLSVHHLALADKEGTARLSHDAAGAWGHSIMTTLSSRGEEVRTQSLAGFMSEQGISRVDFAKLNCEGAEFPILIKAPPETLARFERMLVLYHCDLAPGYELEDLTAALEGAGFTLEIKANKKQRGRIIARRTSPAKG